MTSRLFLRTETESIPETYSDGIVLDIGTPNTPSTFTESMFLFEQHLGITSSIARDLFHLAASVYAADKLIRRRVGRDFWSRDIALNIPVSDHATWSQATEAFENALRFLSQDRWHLEFRERPSHNDDRSDPDWACDAVGLFSGGLDSLVGTIDYLENNPTARLLTVGHHDASGTDTLQREVFSRIVAAYGDRVRFIPILARPVQRAGSAYPLPSSRTWETTTRSRSFLFIALAVIAGSIVGRRPTIRVPENGFIALNVPLGEDRFGSCSTRTAHPHFLSLYQAALHQVGITVQLDNPYMYATKGEMLAACRNSELLQQIERRTVSCSHPEQARWRGESGFKRNCGYCYPCVIRRSSLNHVDRDRASEYREDVAGDLNLVKSPRCGKDVRAVLESLSHDERMLAVTRPGPLPDDVSISGLVRMYTAGRSEIRSLFVEKGSRAVKRYAGL